MFLYREVLTTHRLRLGFVIGLLPVLININIYRCFLL